MWGFLAKILGEAGKKAATEVVKKTATEATKKVAQQAAKKTAMGVAQKIAGAAETASSLNKNNGSLLSKVLNVVTGDLGKNSKGAGSMIGRAGEQPKGTWFNKVKGVITGDLQEAAKKNAINKLPEQGLNSALTNANTSSLRDAINKVKGGKTGQSVQKLIGGDTLGSKLFLNTLSNLGQSGAFSGSDVGQPDKNFGGMLANSFASALGQSVGERRHESYVQEQNMLNMAQDFDPAMDALQRWQPKILEKIDAFKGNVVNRALDKRKKGGWLNSEDMIQVQSDYIGLKKELSGFNAGVKVLQQEYATITDPKQVSQWDKPAFDRDLKYFLESGRMPAKGSFLEPAEISPEEYFSKKTMVGSGDWQPKSKDEWWIESSGISQDVKNKEAMADWLTNPRLRKWATNNGIDLNDNKNVIDLSIQYGPLIDKDRTNYEKYYRAQEAEQRQAETRANKANTEQDKLGYAVSGDRVIFTRDKTENVLQSTLSNATGQPLSGSGDDAIPVKFESIGPNGELIVTATVKDEPESTMKQFSIAPNKAKGLADAFYPGAYSKATAGYVPPKAQVPYNNDLEDKIAKFMDANPKYSDRDAAIKKLKELKIL
jgi:hypothetical protein